MQKILIKCQRADAKKSAKFECNVATAVKAFATYMKSQKPTRPDTIILDVTNHVQDQEIVIILALICAMIVKRNRNHAKLK
jgi:hypothetical protein